MGGRGGEEGKGGNLATMRVPMAAIVSNRIVIDEMIAIVAATVTWSANKRPERMTRSRA